MSSRHATSWCSTFVATIRTLNAQLKDLERQIRTQLRAHPDGRIFLSLFKSPASVITAAELLAELGGCRARYPTRDALAADAARPPSPENPANARPPASAGDATSGYASRSADSQTAAATGTPGQRTSTPKPASASHEHPRAIRTLGRAWCRIVWQCWQHRTPYDPSRHRALQRHITVTIPTPSGPVPDLPATQRMAGAAVTQRRPAWAERAALDNKPPPAISHGRLTQDVFGDKTQRRPPVVLAANASAC